MSKAPGQSYMRQITTEKKQNIDYEDDDDEMFPTPKVHRYPTSLSS